MLLVNRVLAIAFIAIGVALIIETAAQGAHGLQVGYLAGAVFIALGLLAAAGAAGAVTVADVDFGGRRSSFRMDRPGSGRRDEGRRP